MLLPQPLFAQLIALLLFFCLLIYTSEIILSFTHFCACFLRSFDSELQFPCSYFKRDEKGGEVWEKGQESVRSLWISFLAVWFCPVFPEILVFMVTGISLFLWGHISVIYYHNFTLFLSGITEIVFLFEGHSRFGITFIYHRVRHWGHWLPITPLSGQENG